jgi:ATP-dependent helicase/nuclease subunit B
MDERILSALREGATVVTASRRLARVFRTQYGEGQRAVGARAWETPNILPWNAWLDALWEEHLFVSASPLVRLGPWQESILWQAAVEGDAGAAILLQQAAAAAEAQAAWTLAAQWRLDLARIEATGNEDARAFAAWASHISEVCLRQGWLDAARTPDTIAAAIPGLRLPTRILFAGFDEFSPQQRHLVEACGHAGCRIEALAAPAPPLAGNAVRVPFPSAEHEIEAAARWARAILERNPAARIGIVAPDLAARRNSVERAFRAALEPGSQISATGEPSTLVNISAGLPLAGYPVVRSALSILSLRREVNEWADITALALDRHLAGSDAERSARARLDQKLRARGLAELTLADVQRQARAESSLCPALAHALSEWQRLYDAEPARQSAAAWARAFSEALKAMGWPGERRLSSAEYQTVEAWRKALSEFAATDFIAGPLTRGEALSFLSRIVGQTDFQPEGPDAPVQVMGALEAAGMGFEHLWVAGLHDEAWPGPPNPNPFLPIRMQREAGVPRCSPEREYAFTSLITTRLLASAPDAVVSYPLAEGDRELAPSPLVLAVPRVEAASLELWNGAAWASAIRQSRQVERLVDEQAPPVPPSERQSGGVKVFQLQAGCPFRAFVELRLGVDELESPGPGLDARQRGNLLHHTLEAFWTKVRSQAELSTRRDIPLVVRQSALSAIKRLEDRRGCALPERFAALECARLERMVSEWLELEKQRGPFEVVRPEAERQAELGGVQFRVRMDRVDRLPDGREIIIDYKTGSPHPSQWDGDRPEEPQLPLYGVIHEKPLAGLLFGRLEAGRPRFLGIANAGVEGKGIEPAELPERLTEWRRVLEHLALEFRQGRAEADPKDPAKTCRYCPLPAVCRGAERGLECLEEAE